MLRLAFLCKTVAAAGTKVSLKNVQIIQNYFSNLGRRPCLQPRPIFQRCFPGRRDACTRMILQPLSLLFAASSGAALLLSLALGLLSLSRYIERQSAQARRIGLYLVYASVLLQWLLIIIDHVPWRPMLPTMLAHSLHYRAISEATWPYVSAGSLSSGLSLCLSLLSHVLLARHHTTNTRDWHTHRYDTLHRPKLPGGRLDWDVDPSTSRPQNEEMTHLQVCAVLAVCVWTVPVWRFLGRVAAAEWGSTGLTTTQRPSR